MFRIHNTQKNTENPKNLTKIQSIIVLLSGLLFNLIFSSLIILGIFAITHCINMPLEIVMSLRAIISISPILSLIGQCIYGVSSTITGIGDFGEIKKHGGAIAVILCAILLISIFLLSILGIVFLT